LGLDDHRLGPAMAEALLHRARADRAALPRLEGQGLASARGGVSAVVVLVAHALALLTAGRIPAISNQLNVTKQRRVSRLPLRLVRLLAPILRKERTEPAQSPDIFGPTLGSSPRKEGGVYHILGA